MLACRAMGMRPAYAVKRSTINRMSVWMICLGLFTVGAGVQATTLEELAGQKDLTPEALAHVVSDFAFELRPQLQAPDAFLKNKNGDCADYANLASTILGKHGYTTKLVVVMMEKQTHVVCYVKEAGGFLDYNHRSDAHPLIHSDGTIEDIANKVAFDFRSQWHMASLFRYNGSSPEFLDNVFAPAAPAPKVETRRIAKSHPSKDKSGSMASAPAPSGAALAMRSSIN